ncbi:MAG: tetratricopeptide repeat protein [Allorhizobium sp.]
MSLSPSVAAFENMTLLKAIGLEPGDLTIGLAVANSMLRRGDGQDALRMYATLALCEPLNFDIQLGLAECCAELEQHDLAIQAAAVLIATSPRDPRGYFLSGRACLMAGYRAEAEEDLTHAIRFGREGGDAAIVAEAERLLLARTSLPAA